MARMSSAAAAVDRDDSRIASVLLSILLLLLLYYYYYYNYKHIFLIFFLAFNALHCGSHQPTRPQPNLPDYQN